MQKVDKILQGVQLNSFGPSVGSLGSSTEDKEGFAKAYRHLERSRRLVVKLHDSVEESEVISCRKFLLDAAVAVEQALPRTTLVSSNVLAARVSNS
jgi:hypothetical protein